MAQTELSYREADSLFHRMTPFSKLLFVLSISTVAIFNNNLGVAIGLFVFSFLIAAFFTGVSLKEYWRFGKVILPFILILAVVFPFVFRYRHDRAKMEAAAV